MIKAKAHWFVAAVFLVGGVAVFATRSHAAPSDKSVSEMNETLKSAIEENQALLQQKTELEDELKGLRQEKEALSGDVEKVRSQNRAYAQEIQKLEQNLQEVSSAKEGSDMKVRRLEEELNVQAGQSQVSGATAMLPAATGNVMTQESQTLNLLSQIDAFAEEDERLRLDAAKAHYNMGNIYFQKGEYEIAAREYYQAVTLMPDDADSHYNLAFVSGENLKDYRTALKHYQMYLYLNPNAKDAFLVKEKIIDAKMHLDNVVDSPLEKKSQ